MKTENSVLMKEARTSLSGKWPVVIGAFVLYVLIIIVAENLAGKENRDSIGALINFIIAGPFALGLSMFTLSISRNKVLKISQIFDGFKNFGDSFLAYLIKTVFTLLWALLLIIPGIIAAISYSMTFFILSDEPSLSPQEAIKKSIKMMDGYKMKYFKLMLMFLGWVILAILTLGIGFLWLIPYVQVSRAKFYEDIKGEPDAVIA